MPSIVAVWNVVNEAKTIAFKRLWLWHCRRIIKNCPHTRDTIVWLRGSLHLANSFNVTPRVQVWFDMVLQLIVDAFQSIDPFPPWGSEKSLPNATWYLWLVLSWPAGSMRCGSIRRCLDDLIFHVLKWPVELCSLFLHLLYVQLIPENRAMTRADCYWPNPFLRLIKQCCSRENKIYFILKPWKAQCRPVLWDDSLCTTGKELEQFESSAFYLWHQNRKNFQQQTSTSSTPPYLQALLSD